MDLLTPIHKGLRSMIYQLGGELQTTDFTDRNASERIVAKLRHDLTVTTASSCVLCVLHEHAGHEETSIFPQLNAHEPALVQEMLDAHSAIVKKLTSISKVSDRLEELQDPSERLRVGKELVQTANDFFAFYLAHMNHEETVVIPATQKHFTDDQLRVIQGKVVSSFTPDQLATSMRWMLPALNVQELTAMMFGLKMGAPAPVFQKLAQVAATHVPADRWNLVAHRVGI